MGRLWPRNLLREHLAHEAALHSKPLVRWVGCLVFSWFLTNIEHLSLAAIIEVRGCGMSQSAKLGITSAPAWNHLRTPVRQMAIRLSRRRTGCKAMMATDGRQIVYNTNSPY